MGDQLVLTQSYELYRRRSVATVAEPEPDQEPLLPPVDRGAGAWAALAGAFIAEAVAWGLPWSFGVFQEYYSIQPEFESDARLIPLIGVTTLGVLYIGSPICLLALRQWPQYQRWSTPVGAIVSALALVAASFSTKVWHLILTQGALYAVGNALVYYPFFILLDGWFVQRKGMAFGIAWASTALSGLICPFVISWCLSRYSFRTTLRIWAIATMILILPVLPSTKPRVPPSRQTYVRRPNLRFNIQRPIVVHHLTNIVQALGVFLPSIYLPTYARAIGLSATTATLSVALLNVGQFIGSICNGLLVDYGSVTIAMLASTVGGTLAIVLVWGFARSAVTVCLFALLYGVSAGSYPSTWPGLVQDAQKRDDNIETGLAYAFMAAGRGIGSVLSGPLSQGLLSLTAGTVGGYGYGSKFMPIIVFSGATMLLSTSSAVFKRLGWA